MLDQELLTFEKDLWRKDLDWFWCIAQVVGGGVVQHRLWVPLQYRVLLGCLLLHLNFENVLLKL
jgi:hypothetical protein